MYTTHERKCKVDRYAFDRVWGQSTLYISFPSINCSFVIGLYTFLDTIGKRTHVSIIVYYFILLIPMTFAI